MAVVKYLTTSVAWWVTRLSRGAGSIPSASGQMFQQSTNICFGSWGCGTRSLKPVI